MSSEINHHKRFPVCATRLKYRQGRELKAVKVYTVANESQHLLIFGVPKINLLAELKQKCNQFGKIGHARNVTSAMIEKGLELEPFTEVYWIKYEKIFDARKFKRYMDAKEFYGGILHISYAPEYETMEELREKLNRRKSEVEYRLKMNRRDAKIMKSEEEDELK